MKAWQDPLQGCGMMPWQDPNPNPGRTLLRAVGDPLAGHSLGLWIVSQQGPNPDHNHNPNPGRTLPGAVGDPLTGPSSPRVSLQDTPRPHPSVRTGGAGAPPDPKGDQGLSQPSRSCALAGLAPRGQQKSPG